MTRNQAQELPTSPPARFSLGAIKGDSLRTRARSLLIKSKDGFTRPELLFVTIVLFLLGAISLYNFRYSEAKARDTHRAESVSRLSDSLQDYFYDYGQYPAADKSGRIVACGNKHSEPCNWGQKFLDYMELPNDPIPQRHFFYQASTDSAKFKLWAAMETRTPVDFGLGNAVPWCGDARCSYGQGSSETVMSEHF